MRADGISARALAPCDSQNPSIVIHHRSAEEIFHPLQIFVPYDSEDPSETSTEDLQEKSLNGNILHEVDGTDKQSLSARSVSSPDKRYDRISYIDDVSSKSPMSTEEQQNSPHSSNGNDETSDSTVSINASVDNIIVVEISTEKEKTKRSEAKKNETKINKKDGIKSDVSINPSPRKGFKSYPGFNNSNCPEVRPDDIIYDEFDESSVSSSYKSIYFEPKCDRREVEAKTSGATPKATTVIEDQCQSQGLDGSSRISGLLQYNGEVEREVGVRSTLRNFRKRNRRTFSNCNEYADVFNCTVESSSNGPADADTDTVSNISSARPFQSFASNISPISYAQNDTCGESVAQYSKRPYPSRSSHFSNTALGNEYTNFIKCHALGEANSDTLQKSIQNNRLSYDGRDKINRIPLENNSGRVSAESDEGATPLRGFSPRYTVGPLENFSKSYYAIAAARSDGTSSVPKSQSCYDYRLPERPRRAAVQHRDADEALSCLLWQPYECRGGEDGASLAESAAAGESCPCPSSPHSRTAARYGELSRAADMRLTVPAPAHGRATNAHPASVVLSLHQPSSETDLHGVNLQQTISHTTASVSNVVHASVIHSASVEGIQDTASNNNACRLSVIGSDGGRRSRDVGVVSVNGEVVSGCSTSVAVPALRTWGSQTEEPGSGAPAPATRVVGPPQLPPPYSTLPHAYSIHAQPQPLPPPPLQQHAYPFQPVSLRRYGPE